MKNFSDIPKSDFEGYPKTVYDDGDDFEEIEHIQLGIPTSGGPEAEDDALLEIERSVKELDQKRRQKLDEIGYESPEDS